MNDASKPARAAAIPIQAGQAPGPFPLDHAFVRDFIVTPLIPLIKQSAVRSLHGLPFPVQFRNQAALDGWRRALDGMEDDGGTFWQRMARPDFTCAQGVGALGEMFRTLIYPHNPMGIFQDKNHASAMAQEVGTNLLYCRRGGALLEVTPVLETWLMHSDFDASLPVGMVVPPFSAQYLRFGEGAGRALNHLAGHPDQVIDGVFCFTSSLTAPDAPAATRQLQFIFVFKRDDQVEWLFKLERPIVSPEMGLAEWVEQFLTESQHTEDPSVSNRRTIELIGYVAKVFLYLGLKEARQVEIRDYTEAQRRMAGIGPKKLAKLGRKIASLYDRIVVGPASLPDAPAVNGSGHAMPPHWRRGHFRMQAHGVGYSQRKMIFVAPLLVHADRLAEEVKDAPQPKNYRAGR